MNSSDSEISAQLGHQICSPLIVAIQRYLTKAEAEVQAMFSTGGEDQYPAVGCRRYDSITKS